MTTIALVLFLATKSVAMDAVFKPHFAQSPDEFTVVASTSVTSYADYKIAGSTPVAPDCVGVSCY